MKDLRNAKSALLFFAFNFPLQEKLRTKKKWLWGERNWKRKKFSDKTDKRKSKKHSWREIAPRERGERERVRLGVCILYIYDTSYCTCRRRLKHFARMSRLPFFVRYIYHWYWLKTICKFDFLFLFIFFILVFMFYGK